MKLTVREIETKDIELIANYWLKPNADFLISMGVDLSKIPTRSFFTNMLNQQLEAPLNEKKSYALIWELDGVQIGHSNVTNLICGEKATMHLHLWQANHRKKGIGAALVSKSLPFYFDTLKIKELFCEPYALNPAPNNTLKKIGFDFLKKYRTIPGGINFEQQVNRWVITKEKYEAQINLISKTK